MKPQSLLVDLDGTLTDNISTMYYCFSLFLASYELTSTRTDFNNYNGMPLRDFVQDLKDKHSLTPCIGVLLKDYYDLLAEHYFSSPLREDALELLKFAKGQGLKIGLVTSGSRVMVEKFLSLHHILSYFDIVVCADDVARGKPDKEPYSRAISVLSVDPSRTYVVEDALNGLISAHASGTQTCFLTPPLYSLSEFEKEVTSHQVFGFKEVIEVLVNA